MALDPIAKHAIELRKENPGMSDEQLAAAVQARALEALKAHAVPRPTGGASAKPEIPLAK